MSDSVPSTAEPEVHDVVMEATWAALREQGYADLTMQAIADEAEKSSSLLHYHYDTKEKLLAAFLEHLLDRFDDELAAMDADGPTERLDALVEKMLPGDDPEAAAEWEQFHRGLLELRTQAPYSEAYREQLRRNKRYVQDRLAETIAEGVERGEFRDVDPEDTARFILSALDGARAARVTLGVEDQPAVRDGLQRFVFEELQAVEGDDESDSDDADDPDDAADADDTADPDDETGRTE